MQYRAFFSYSRSDDRIANWLHRQLDGYRTPKALVGVDGALGPVPAKLHPIFRDRTDMSGGGQLSERIEEALKDSETLIVLCSPASAASTWVNREVETFIALGRTERIFPVIAAGLPDTGDVERDFFPPALRGLGLLAADLREIKQTNGKLIGDGREGGRIKLIAGLLGMPLDALAQRERRRQRQIIALLGAAALVFAGVATLAGVQSYFAYQNQQRALRGEAEAIRQQGIAEANAAAEARERQRADSETLRAIESAREAERQEGFASENARQARLTLHRFFASRAQDRFNIGDLGAGARYALAGLRLSRENRQYYIRVLRSIMYKAGVARSRPLLDFSQDEMRLVAGPSTNSDLIAHLIGDRLIRITRIADVSIIREIHLAYELTGESQFSFNGDYFVAALSDGQIHAWDLRSEDAYRRCRGNIFSLSPMQNHMAAQTQNPSLLFSRDPNTTQLLDLENGGLLASYDTRGFPRARPIFSPDGGQLVLTNREGELVVHVIDNEADQVIIRADNEAPIGFSPDGGVIATRNGHGTVVSLWSADNGTFLKALRLPATYRSLSFSNDGRILLITSNQRVHLFSAPTWEPVLVPDFVNSGPIQAAALAPNGRRITTLVHSHLNTFALHRNNTEIVWSHISNLHGYIPSSAIIRYLSGGGSIVTAAPGATRLWTGADSHGTVRWTVRINLDSHRESVVRSLLGPNAIPTAAMLSPDRHTFLLNALGEFRIYSLETGERLRDVCSDADEAGFFHDSSVVCYYQRQNGSVEMAPASDRHRVLFETSAPSRSRALSLSSSGRGLVNGSDVWDTYTGQPMDLGGPIGLQHKVAISPNGMRAVTFGRTRPNDPTSLRLSNTATGRIVSEREHRSLEVLKFSNSGATFITAGASGSVELWSASDGELIRAIRGSDIQRSSRLNAYYVTDVSFSPADDAIAISYFSGAWEIWDLGTGEMIWQQTDAASPVPLFSFFLEDGNLLSVSWDGTMTRWDTNYTTWVASKVERDACALLLGVSDRRFLQAEIDADPLLRSEWPDPNRDVCEGVPGVPPIAELRLAAGLPATPPQQRQ